MPATDTSPFRPRDINTAIALLTRLPVRADFSRGARAAWAYGLAGAVLALLAALPTAAALWVGLPPVLAAVIWLTGMVVMSGAMHEDGLADTADGFWGGWEPARRLEIMKDSRIGAYGVIALCLSLAARWGAITLLLEADVWLFGMLAVAMLSRSAMVLVMSALPHARANGLSHAQGRAPRGGAITGFALAAVVAFGCAGIPGIVMTGVAFVMAALCSATAKVKIGGQTGDVLGATQQVTEIALLFTLVAAAQFSWPL
ncbi:adenosylcobinamide-GDP ribazoletransferase [Shimia sp. R10_1]|uniref:adenosylcobinamide-GDP ribazoletransferase n=1 Tax=Shimia sp. R10_1 TaxID=2821095 RepID=UPI001AD9E915|nr:adenosylcobinamide-GDP ribazoletransferase [Shimia sp. R10_1]MBO9472525.1 adenosylcobinamide-GDP ribazoletransferase [Shimia sp. R10_1]